MYADFIENTWPKFLKELLNEDNFGLQREIQGEVWATPAWTHCLEYEYQLRKEALRLCFEEGFSIQGAHRSTHADPQHRMKHWIQLLATANCGSSSSNADQQKVATLERKVAELERKNRFTSTTSNQRHRQDEQKCTTRDPKLFSSSEWWWQKQGNQGQRQ